MKNQQDKQHAWHWTLGLALALKNPNLTFSPVQPEFAEFLTYFCCLLIGLKQALATVNDYNPLMKDFPINDLLAATELDRIRQAVSSIFIHLRKIRSTKYPILRALRLVEAISRDLSAQLLKVSSTN